MLSKIKKGVGLGARAAEAALKPKKTARDEAIIEAREASRRGFLEGSAVTNPAYHATTKSFKQFSPHLLGEERKAGTDRLGFWFSENPGSTEFYIHDPTFQAEFKEGANIIPAYLRMLRPYRMDADEFYDLSKKNVKAGEKLKKQLQTQGFDGVIAETGDGNAYAVFEPTQIKSAIGMEGRYDIEDPDITKAAGGTLRKLSGLGTKAAETAKKASAAARSVDQGALSAVRSAGKKAFEEQAGTRAEIDAEIAERLAKLPPRSKAANEALGLYHPIGGGLKLSRPIYGFHATTVPDPMFNPPPISIITPEQLVKEEAAMFPLVGDRAAAGRYLTHVGEVELERPVRLTGGPLYMDANYNLIDPDQSAAWESGLGRVTALSRQAARAGEGGRPVYGIYTAGSATNTDFNIMGADALIQQLPYSKISKKAEKEFDRAMKEGSKAFPPIPDWPGIRSPKAEEMLLDKSNGMLRTKLFDTMGKENFQSMGFPDVAATRKAIIQPELLDVDTHQTGFRLARMDTTGRTIENPLIPSDYPVAMAGQVAGQLDIPVDYKDFWQSHFDARRLLSQPESGDYYSFSRAHPIQYADDEWLNRLREKQYAIERKIKEGKAAGGAVGEKAKTEDEDQDWKLQQFKYEKYLEGKNKPDTDMLWRLPRIESPKDKEAYMTKAAAGGAVDAYQAQQQSQSKRAQDVAAYKEGKIGADELLKYYPGLTATMIEEQLAEMAEGGKVDSSDYEGPSLEDIINEGANDRAHQEWLENSSIQMLNFQLDDALDKYRKGLVGEEALMRFFPGYTEYDISRMFGVTDQSPRNVKNMVPPVLTPKVFRESQSQAEEMERNAKRFPEMQRGFQLANGGPIEVKKKAGGPVFSQDQVFADLGDPSTVMTFGSLAMAKGGEVKLQAGGGSRQAIQEQLSAGVPVFMSKGPEGQVARDIITQEEKERERQEAERRARMQAKPFSEKFGGGYEAFQTLQSALGRSLAAPFVALSQGEEAARKFSDDIKIPESEYGLYALERTGEFLDPLAKALQESKITDAPYMPELGFTYIPGLGRQVADIARRTGKMAGEAIPPALKDLPVGMSIEAVGPEGKKLSVNDLIRMLEAGEEMTPEQRQKAEYSKAQKEKYAQANVAKAQKEPAPKEEAVKVPANEQGFFSSVEKAAANLKREEGSGDAFLSDIMKFNPSAGELEATGIVDFLKGKKSVTRQEVQDYIDQHSVQIEEVIRGTILDDVDRQKLNDINRRISRGFREMITPEEEEWFEATRDRLAQFKEPRFEREGLILPGGKNYKEILLKFPMKQNAPVSTEKSAATMLFENNMKEKYGGETFPSIYNRLTPDEVEKYEMYVREDINSRKTESVLQDKRNNFRTAHWPDDPNTFMHLRMQDMTINGKKTLVIEEIQSDWHQEGRKKGYQRSKNLTPDEIDLKFVKSEVPEGQDPSIYPGYYEAFDKSTGEFLGRHSGTLNRDQAMRDAVMSANQFQTGVPNAPFKKDWYQLGVKRLLKYASDNDYDQVALVGPDEQIRRGSLGTHIDGLIYEKNADGTIKLMAEKGESVVLDKTVEPKDLDLYVGKDVAKRILESKETDGTLTGDDLKIGGEGMRQYYGRNYPEYMNKLGRDYGTQAKKTQYTIKEFGPNDVEEVPTGEADRYGREVMAYQIRDPETDEIITYETDFEKALKEANKKAPSTDMWVMDLPAKMKSDIKIGQPFKKGGLVKKDEALANWNKAQTKGRTVKMSELIRFG